MTEHSIPRPGHSFRRVVQRATVAVLVKDERGFFLYANPAAEALLGALPGQLNGRHISDLIESEEQWLHAQFEQFKLDRLWNCRVRVRHMRGQPIPVGIHGFGHADPDGTITYAGLLCRLREDVPRASAVTVDDSRYNLDERDHGLLRLLAEGFSEEQIAILIGGISLETIRKRVLEVRQKMNAASTTEACILAMKAHLLF